MWTWTFSVAVTSRIPIAILLLTLGGWPAAAMTEHCMIDGDDVKATFFATPTVDTTPVRVVIAGYTYSIPRNYFRFPKVECRSGETRSFVLRMTLPDFLPATDETWDRLYGQSAGLDQAYIQVQASSQTVRDMSWLMRNYTAQEIVGWAAPSMEGLSSLVQGPLNPQGYPMRDVYYGPDRERPQVIIGCTPIGKLPRSGCDFLFPHNGLVFTPFTMRENLARWHEVIVGLKARIDSFIINR